MDDQSWSEMCARMLKPFPFNVHKLLCVCVWFLCIIWTILTSQWFLSIFLSNNKLKSKRLQRTREMYKFRTTTAKKIIEYEIIENVLRIQSKITKKCILVTFCRRFFLLQFQKCYSLWLDAKKRDCYSIEMCWYFDQWQHHTKRFSLNDSCVMQHIEYEKKYNRKNKICIECMSK